MERCVFVGRDYGCSLKGFIAIFLRAFSYFYVQVQWTILWIVTVGASFVCVLAGEEKHMYIALRSLKKRWGDSVRCPSWNHEDCRLLLLWYWAWWTSLTRRISVCKGALWGLFCKIWSRAFANGENLCVRGSRIERVSELTDPGYISKEFQGVVALYMWSSVGLPLGKIFLHAFSSYSVVFSLDSCLSLSTQCLPCETLNFKFIGMYWYLNISLLWFSEMILLL